MTDWREIEQTAKTLVFFAREFEGADEAEVCEVIELVIYKIDPTKAGKVSAIRAKRECEKLMKQLEDYHRFISDIAT
jgi:hypothetical protein